MFGLPWDQVGPILVGLGSFVGTGGLVHVIFQRQKLKREAEKVGADATQVITTTATGLLVAARNEVAEMHEDNQRLRDDFDFAMDAMDVYVQAVSSHIHTLERMVRGLDPTAYVPQQPPRPRLRRPRPQGTT